jgi:hypothetical protein
VPRTPIHHQAVSIYGELAGRLELAQYPVLVGIEPDVTARAKWAAIQAELRDAIYVRPDDEDFDDRRIETLYNRLTLLVVDASDVPEIPDSVLGSGRVICVTTIGGPAWPVPALGGLWPQFSLVLYVREKSVEVHQYDWSKPVI